MGKHLLVINGHPDPRPERYCSALSQAFGDGARDGGWSVHTLDAATLHFNSGKTGADISLDMAARLIHATDRLAIVFPLWFDDPPQAVGRLLAHAVQSQANAPDTAERPKRIAQLVVTMEMPAFIHRSMVRADGKRGDGRKLESLPGFDAAHVTFIGSVGAISLEQRQQWLREIRELGVQSERVVKLPRKWLPDVRALTMRAA